MKKTLNMVTSLGAAIVILGAWMKITHHRYADLALTLGLWTEAIIFVIYAFLPEEGEPGGVVEFGPTDSLFSAPNDPRTEDYVNGRFG